MDGTDKKILNILQGNARISMKELGNMVGLTIASSSWPKLAKYCEDSPYVLELYHTIGVYGATMKVFVPDTAQFEGLLKELGKFGNTVSSVILSSKFSKKELPE